MKNNYFTTSEGNPAIPSSTRKFTDISNDSRYYIYLRQLPQTLDVFFQESLPFVFQIIQYDVVMSMNIPKSFSDTVFFNHPHFAQALYLSVKNGKLHLSAIWVKLPLEGLVFAKKPKQAICQKFKTTLKVNAQTSLMKSIFKD